MKMKKNTIAYCPFCNSNQPFESTVVSYDANVRGVRFTAKRHQTKCCKCGQDIYVPEIMDSDLQESFEQYKSISGLLTAKEIKAFRKQHGLSAVSLARLLGLGDKTITRLENGDIQNRSTDREIRLLMLCYDELEPLLSKGVDIANLLHARLRILSWGLVKTYSLPISAPLIQSTKRWGKCSLPSDETISSSKDPLSLLA